METKGKDDNQRLPDINEEEIPDPETFGFDVTGPMSIVLPYEATISDLARKGLLASVETVFHSGGLNIRSLTFCFDDPSSMEQAISDSIDALSEAGLLEKEESCEHPDDGMLDIGEFGNPQMMCSTCGKVFSK